MEINKPKTYNSFQEYKEALAWYTCDKTRESYLVILNNINDKVLEQYYKDNVPVEFVFREEWQNGK